MYERTGGFCGGSLDKLKGKSEKVKVWTASPDFFYAVGRDHLPYGEMDGLWNSKIRKERRFYVGAD